MTCREFLTHGTVTLGGVGVVMAAYERPERTLESVASVLRAGVSAEQIVLVDGGSAVRTLEELRQKLGPVRVIAPGRNLWWAEAMNVGLKTALARRWPALLLLNQDCVAGEGAIARLIEVATARPEAVALCCVVRSRERPSVILEGGTCWAPHESLPFVWRMKRAPEWVALDGALVDGAAETPPYDVDILTAHCVLARRELFEVLGGFDAVRFPQRGGDDDLGLRCRARGGRILVVPGALAYTGEEDCGAARGPGRFVPRVRWLLFSFVGGRALATHLWFCVRHCPTWAIAPTYLYRIVNVVRAAWRATGRSMTGTRASS